MIQKDIRTKVNITHREHGKGLSMPAENLGEGTYAAGVHLQFDDPKPASTEQVDLRPFGFMLIGMVVASSTATILGAIYVGGFSGIVIGAASTAPGGMLGYSLGWVISKIWRFRP